MRERTAQGDIIRSMRLARQIRQKDLATQVGITAPHLNHIEGNRAEPGDLLALRIAEALGCSVTDFSTPGKTKASA